METLHSLHVQIAKKAIECYVLSFQPVDLADVPELGKEQNVSAGAFVSIKKEGRLRGCIGTLEPTRPSLAEEIISNAVKSASSDPRFPPITTQELSCIDITVDVLTPLEPVLSKAELDPLKYGVVVSSAGRKGTLLPALDGVETVEQQIAVCRAKGGIGQDDDITLHRFEVRRYR